ncbi:MAG: sigma-54 factor interaction domain-containing protein [Desulfohalobiaceae bacterium]|nr:sigma-54 factor interaction domain-containing protein [Desulfohalobiaceae bacterium]
MAQVKMIADTDASVLIAVETGTGKDYIARCIHNFSSRKRPCLSK